MPVSTDCLQNLVYLGYISIIMSRQSIVTVLFMTLPLGVIWCQGLIEADKVKADTVEAAFKGDGSNLINLPNQNLVVSVSGDTLYITEGNWVLIPGLSSSNSGNVFANAGVDIVNSCQTSFNLNAAPLAPGSTGQWSIISGSGGNLVDSTHPNALFIGHEGESYILKWTVQHSGGSSSFDQLNISIAVNTETSLADAGADLFAIMTQTITLNGNTPEMGSSGQWTILNGTGGVISDISDPGASFTGVPGESYTLHWRHFNECSSSNDEVSLTFSESAAGVPSSNGRYYIPDPKFRQYLQILYPSAMDEDSLIIAKGNQVIDLNITDLEVLNLDGLQFLTNLETFQANSGFVSIPFFSDKLRKLVCDCSRLKVIPEFPESLDTLRAVSWPITQLPDFPIGLKSLYLLFMRELHILPHIPDSCLYANIRGGFCCPEIYFTDTFNIPEMATYFSISGFDAPSFPTLPTDFSNLEFLEIRDVNITLMPSIIDFNNLKNLVLSGNELVILDYLPLGLESLNITGNPILCVKNKPPLLDPSVLAPYPICP